jgi:hypothetical protein
MEINFGKKYMATLAFGIEPIENGLPSLTQHSSSLNGESQPTNLLKWCSSLLDSIDTVGKEMM